VARLDHLTRVQALALARGARRGLARTASDARGDAALARVLLELLDAKDAVTRAHSERVGAHAARLAAELGETAELVERTRLTGLLHDLGNVGVPDSVLGKPAPLSARDWSAMRRHPELGARVLAPLESLADVALYVRHHHEWFDGSARGYPDRLQGEQIPLPSRIVAVADALDAMTLRRGHRRARALESALEELRAGRGLQFDPAVVDAAERLARVPAGTRGRSTLRCVREPE
jgi:HD-GYP domain-containing protein (c-di-GMP phosphodiesterase class II)